jgi:PAS domain S-box-containing protein
MNAAPRDRPLRILHLEDNEADAELLEAHLSQEGLNYRMQRVETRESFERALEVGQIDIVLADFNLPTLCGLEALDLCKARRPDLPFLLVSGTVGEEVAVECLKQGATDYFLKHRLQRLVPGIHRALAEADLLRERSLAQEAQRRQAEEFRALAENTPDALIRFDLDRRIRYVNHTFTIFCGILPEHAIGHTLSELRYPEECVDDMGTALDDVFIRKTPATLGFISPSHPDRYYEARLGPEFDSLGHVVSAVCVIRDTTEARLSEAALEASEARYRRLFDQNPQPLWVYEKGTFRILAVNEAASRHYGYRREEFLTLTILDLRSPEDARNLKNASSHDVTGFRFSGTYRHQAKDGRQMDVEIYAHDIQFEGKEATLVFPLDVTERRKTQQALETSERLHRSLVDTLVEGVMVRDPDGVLVAANPRVFDIFGTAPGATLGRKVLDPQLPVIDDKGRPLPPEAQPDAVALATGQPLRNVIIGVRRPDGRLVWVQVNCSPFLLREGDTRPGLVISFSDITTQRAATEAIRLAAAERLELLEAAGVARAVPWSEQANHQLHIGESAPSVLGLDDGHLPGAGYLLGLLEEEDRPLFLRAQAQARNGELATFEARVRKAGQLLWTRWTVGCDHGLLRGVVQDISEQHHLQDQLLQSQKLEVLGSLVSGIAHDFNNLLMAILGHGQVLELEDLTPSQRRKLESILQASMRGRTLVGQLMNIGRRKVEMRARSPLNHVVEEVAALLEHALPRSINLHLDLDPKSPELLMDANQIHQVVMNLAINARDAMGESGTLTFKTSTRSLPSEGEKPSTPLLPYASLEVSDTGSGIPQELIARIFEPFFTTKEEGKGTGLGLAVVRRIVDGHRGILQCDSVPGKGTTFRILLPLQAAPFPTEGTVGLLDDPSRERAELQAFLESEGLTVLASEHGAPLQSCAAIIVHVEAMEDGLAQAAELLANRPDLKLFLASRDFTHREQLALLPSPPEALLHYPYDSEEILTALQGVRT